MMELVAMFVLNDAYFISIYELQRILSVIFKKEKPLLRQLLLATVLNITYGTKVPGPVSALMSQSSAHRGFL